MTILRKFFRALGGCMATAALAGCGSSSFLTAPNAPSSGPASGGSNSQIFGFKHALQRFQVPAGVTQLTAVVDGASGADAIGRYGRTAKGGLGGAVTATVTVTPGETLTIVVGGAGSQANQRLGKGGYNGGGNGGSPAGGTGLDGSGGGGASDVRQGGSDLADRILVAAGGGGAGGYAIYGAGDGGAGGANRGENGQGPSPGQDSEGFGGSGGRQHAGGRGGRGGSHAGFDQGSRGKNGRSGIGGDGGARSGLFGGGGGGAGGGYYGGGGGGGGTESTSGFGGGGGGAGGSSFVEASAINIINLRGGAVAGNGSIALYW